MTNLIALFLFSLPLTAENTQTWFDLEYRDAKDLLLDEQDSPRSVVHAYRCYRLKDRLSDPAELQRLFGEVAKSPRACDILKSHAEWFLASLDLSRGDLRKAESRRRRLGFISDWWVIGPFDNEGKGGYERAFPPEKKIDLSASYKGREREVTWRKFPPIGFAGYQNLSAVFRPALQVCAYAVAGVMSDRTKLAAVRLGSDDAAKVWVNGQLVVETPAYRSAAFDQDAGGCILRKGFNFILVKICQKDGGWGFRLRLTTTSGGPLSGVRVVSAEKLAKQRFAKSGVEHDSPKVASPLADLEAGVQESPGSVQALRDLGYFLEVNHPHDSGEQAHLRTYEKALEIAPEDIKTLMRLATASIDHNEKRTYFERALKVNSSHAPALYGLSTYYRSRRNRDREMQLLKQALVADPDFFPAELVLAYSYAFRPLRGLAWQMIRPLKERFPNVTWVDYQIGVIAEALGYHDRSIEAYEQYLKTHWQSNTVRRYILKQALKQRDQRLSLKLYDAMIRAQPSSLTLRREKALLLANNGKLGQGIDLLQECLSICPEHPEVLRNLGDLQKRQARDEEALASWRKSLEIHPQNPSLQEYLEFFASEDDPFEAPFMVDAVALSQEPLQPGKYPDDSTLILAEIAVEKLHQNGTTSRFTQKVVRILTERGTREQRLQRVYFTASKERGKIEYYRVIKPDGRELTSGEVDERRVVRGEHNTFYDYRVKRLRLPQLEIGDVIEVRQRVSDVAQRSYFGEHFGRMQLFRAKYPIRLKKYVLLAPSDRKLYYHHEKLGPPEVRPGEWKTYIWSIRDAAGIPGEPHLPPATSIAPYVHVSSFRNWEEVAEYYQDMVRDQFQLDGAVRKAVAEITGKEKDDLGKIKALYHYLSRQTRYVGLEFGIHGYLPYPAYQVFARKYGDCKDKAVLLASMLREVDVDAQVALVRTRLRGSLHSEPASLAAFDHAICYVPKYDLWLDCTTEFNGTKEVPEMDRGALALLIGTDGKGGLRTPPESAPSDNRVALDVGAALDAKGLLKGKGKEAVVGTHCPQFRQAYRQNTRHQIVFEGLFRRYHPSARVTKMKVSDLDDLEKPINLDFEFAVPLYAKVKQGEMLFAPSLLQDRLVRRYAALSKRTMPLRLFTPWSQVLKFQIKLPDGCEVLHLPSAGELKTEFGSFSFSLASEKQTLTVRTEVSLNRMLVSPEQYPAFREFCQKVDEKLSETVRVRLKK